jgi:hypothetical protein
MLRLHPFAIRAAVLSRAMPRSGIGSFGRSNHAQRCIAFRLLDDIVARFSR